MAEYILIIFFVAFFYTLAKQQNKNRTKNDKKMKFGRVSQTLKGDIVRSKGEKRIADWLYSRNIDYNYEPKLSSFVPDFYLPEYKMIIEYYGMRDAPGRIGIEYREKINQKRKYFSNLSVKLLELYHEDLSRLDLIIPEILIKQG